MDDPLEWNDLSLILAIARAGSLSGAARALKVKHSTVYRRLNSVEERTGVRFFERLSEGYQLNDAGEATLKHAEKIEAEVHALGREILGKDLRLSGKVRVTAPEGMAAQILPPSLVRFRREHPDVYVDVHGTTASLSLEKREAEIAIRATRRPPDAALGKKIGRFGFSIYSTERYMKAHARRAIQELDWCLIEGIEDWLVPLLFKKREQVLERAVIRSPSTTTVMEAAKAGGGLTVLPFYLGDACRSLRRVGKPLEPLELELWVLTHPDLRHTARVKALMEFIVGELKEKRALFDGKSKREKSLA